MKTITINSNDAGQRLDKFLSKSFPRLPASLMYKNIRTKNIKKNGKRCHIDDRLLEGDILSLYIDDDLMKLETDRMDFLKSGSTLNIIFEDENIILCDKPPSLVVHESNTELFDTLINRIKRYLYQKGEYDPNNELSFAPSLCNRIDRNTSGIVIAAKNAESLRILNEKIKKRELEKKYILIIHGRIIPRNGTLESFLEKDSDTNFVSVRNKKSNNTKVAITKYHVIEEKADFSLVEAELVTGRTHQIRTQFSHIGHPLVGDTKYGKTFILNGKEYRKQMLCSYFLKFNFQNDAGKLNYLNHKEFKIDKIWFLNDFFDQI